MQKKKLQVFVSSTFTDMLEERQAAVEAILTAGHIPAGMELFAAGDQTQLQVIRRWIDESDVFLLLLGGRYGSLDPASGRSYIEVEYEHALTSAKPLFAVVIDADALEQKVRRLGTAAVETAHAQKLATFRAQVLSRVVRFWSDPRDIKLAVLEALAEYGRREDLHGWIRSTEQVNVTVLAEEIARLAKENAVLRTELATKREPDSGLIYQGLTFDEFYRLLAETPSSITDESLMQVFLATAQAFGDMRIGLLHVLWVLENPFRAGLEIESNNAHFIDARLLEDYGVLENWAVGAGSSPSTRKQRFGLSTAGHQFLLRLRVKRDVTVASRYKIESEKPYPVTA